MKNLLILLVTVLFVKCGDYSPQKKRPLITISESLESTTIEGEEILVGKIDLAQLDLFSPWYAKEYEFYKIDASKIEKIKPLLKDVSFVLLMGTWCEDSQREVGGMFKILEAAGYPINLIEIIAVSEDKDTPNRLEKPFDLYNVPTLIFNKDGKEMNRIVEFPIQTLEQDILEILKGNPYKNAYAE
tara:strand:- start:179 stop:736 length:558 start_codon:yes stop_codon:yes gene_type:complete